MSRRSLVRRSTVINIPVTPETLGLIDQAARDNGKTRTGYIVDTIREAAVLRHGPV